VQLEIPIIDLKETGKAIKQLRTDRGFTVKDLQEVLGFANPTAIYKWENGHSLPTLDNLLILAHLFHTNVDAMLRYSLRTLN